MSNQTDRGNKDLLIEAAELTNEVAKTMSIDSFTHAETIAYLFQQILCELRGNKNTQVYDFEQALQNAEAQVYALVDKRIKELLSHQVIPLPRFETVAQVNKSSLRFWRGKFF